MPKSRNRKGHKEKSNARKKTILTRKAQMKAQFEKWVKLQQEQFANQTPT